MIGLIGIDVDGTLVGSSGVVAPRIWQTAQRARDAGIRLALCTGRAAFGVAHEYAKQLDCAGWHSFQNGASILHLSDGRSLSESLPSQTIKMLIAQSRLTGRLLELYSDRDYVTESPSDWGRSHASLLGVPFNPRPLESLSGPIVRAQWLVPPEDVAVVTAQAPAQVEIAQSSSPLMPGTRFVGITRAGISKASAMRMIAKDYGVALANIMYVGDADNDLSALHAVGWPVAMKNSSAGVIAAARKIVGHVDEAGLAEALEFAIAQRL